MVSRVIVLQLLETDDVLQRQLVGEFICGRVDRAPAADLAESVNITPHAAWPDIICNGGLVAIDIT